MAKRHATTASTNNTDDFTKDERSGTYICSDCNYTNQDKRAVKWHCKLHQPNRKIFQCEKCIEKYTKKQALDNHVKRVHKQTVATFKNALKRTNAEVELSSGFALATKECALARPFNVKFTNCDASEPRLSVRVSTTIDRLLLANNNADRVVLNGLLLKAANGKLPPPANDDETNEFNRNKWLLVPQTNGRIYVDKTQAFIAYNRAQFSCCY